MILHILSAIGVVFFSISILVGVHEWGHMQVARWCGVKVIRFAIGFGKTLICYRSKKNIEYCINAIPFGGYVKLLDESEDTVLPEERHLTFNHQPVIKRCAIIVAGPIVNILFAIVALWMTYVIGFDSAIPVIGKVLPNSIAAESGLAAQQEILSIDETPIKRWKDVSIAIMLKLGNKDTMSMVTRPFGGGPAVQHQLLLDYWWIDELKPALLESLGFLPFLPPADEPWPPRYLHHYQYNVFYAWQPAFNDTRQLAKVNSVMIGKLLTGVASMKILGGPITLFEGATQAVSFGLTHFLRFLAYVSVSLGMVNLFPIPGLDGGQLLYLVIEGLRGRPLSTRLQTLLFRLGMITLLVLMIQTVVYDVMRL